MNRVILCGNVGKAPEIRKTQGGESVANFSLATSERWTDRASGDKKEQTTWHRVVCFGKLAGVIESYVGQGSKLLVEGSLTSRKYVDNKSSEERTVYEIKAQNVELLTTKGNGNGAAAPAPADSSRDHEPPPF